MKVKAHMTLEEAMAKEKGTLSQLVLKYTSVMKQLLDQAKDNPGFTTKSWAPLAEMVDVDNFERIGTWKEVVNWQQYEKLLTQWAVISDWSVRVRRITEQPGYVFMELAEFGSYKGTVPDDSIYSLSVYEFNEKNKLRHLDVYMQRENVPIAPGSWEPSKEALATS